MKFAVSNIAWDHAELAEHLALLHGLGCTGVELAPSRIWEEPLEAPDWELARVRDVIRTSGLELVGLHALLFTRPDLELFESRDTLASTVEYLKGLAGLCGALGGRILVFGSPRNRRRRGRDRRECLAWAADAFRETAAEARRHGVTVCIEPLPESDTDFVVSSGEGMELVRLVGDPNFGLHLDARAMTESGEDFDVVFARYGDAIRHFHVGDPGLAPPGSTGVDHARIGAALRRSPYDGYVSIEMRTGFGETREVITRSVRYVSECYG